MSQYSFEGVPGKVTVIVTASKNGVTFPDGSVHKDGLTLADWHERLGGDEADLPNPATGEKVHISLKKWANEDPKNTYINVAFSFSPNRPVAPEHAHLFPANVNDPPKKK